MRHNGNLNGLVDKFYEKTYGKVAFRDDRINFKKQKEEKCSLISVRRSKGESLPPIIKKALKYLYPAKVAQEVNPVTEYDKALRNLSEYSVEVSNKTKRFFQKKKRSLDDIYEYKPTKAGKSNSQEYINCLGYNGQAESEYMMTKQGIKEYTSLYNLIIQDSGLRLEKTRLNKSPRKVKEKYF